MQAHFNFKEKNMADTVLNTTVFDKKTYHSLQSSF